MKLKTTLIVMVLACLMGCQEAEKVQHDEFEPGPYRQVGRITSIEPHESDIIDFGEPTSVVNTSSGLFTIKGLPPTFKKYYPVYMQGDFIFFKNAQGIMKKYELW